MADPEALAASIVCLVTVASKVVKLCYDYCSEAMNTREDVGEFVSEISSLASLLEPISTPAEASKIPQTPDLDLMSQLVHECTEMLGQLEGQLQGVFKKQSDRKPGNPTTPPKISLEWPFGKKGNGKRIQKIKRLKAAVTLKPGLWVTYTLRSQTRRAETISEKRSSE